MRPAPGLTVSAPSFSLLHFLRSQSEQLCFFRPTCTSIPHSSRSREYRPSPRRLTHKGPNATISFSSTLHRRATIKSLSLSLEGVRPLSKHGNLCPLTLRHERGTRRFHPQSETSNSSRHASTESRPLLHKLWKQKERKEKSNLKPTDLPPLPSFLDDVGGKSIGRNKSGKAANELKLRCTEFDKDGKVTLMDGEFKKTELIAKVCIRSAT